MSAKSILSSVPGQASDQMLLQLRIIAHKMRAGPISALEAESLLHHLPELLDEVQELRTVTGRANILPFPVLNHQGDGAA